MIKEKTLEPRLRFCEYGGRAEYLYESKLFEDIFVFSTGKNIKQGEASPCFKTPCVRYGELYHMYNEVITAIINKTNIDKADLKFSDGDEILLPSAGEDPLDIGSASALTLKDVAIGRTINILKPAKLGVYDQRFASYYINQKLRKKISTLARGASISNVYNSDLKKLEMHFPPLPEQQKISDFLTAVDGRIEGLEKKRDLLKEYKKGLMQKLFNQFLRFMDENGKPFPDWEEKKLGEVASKVRDKNTASTERAVLTNSATQGIVDQRDYFDKDIANQENLEGYYIVEVDDFVYNPRISATAPVGPFKRNELRRGIMSPLYTVIRFETGELNFCQAYFSTTYWHKYMCAVANYGARHDRMNITGSDFFDMPIPFPCLEEQRKIADCLSAVDRKIGQVETQVEQTRAFKQGLLQKMFV